MELEFRKLSKLKGVERGYYFNNKLLSRYKTEAIAMLRKRIEDAGHGDWVLPEEAEAITIEYNKATEKTRKTHEKKKPIYAQMHISSLKNRISFLENWIERLELRKKDVGKIFDDKIEEKRKEQQEITALINASQENPDVRQST
jgi:hypothetical protein